MQIASRAMTNSPTPTVTPTTSGKLAEDEDDVGVVELLVAVEWLAGGGGDNAFKVGDDDELGGGGEAMVDPVPMPAAGEGVEESGGGGGEETSEGGGVDDAGAGDDSEDGGEGDELDSGGGGEPAGGGGETSEDSGAGEVPVDELILQMTQRMEVGDVRSIRDVSRPLTWNMGRTKSPGTTLSGDDSRFDAIVDVPLDE